MTRSPEHAADQGPPDDTSTAPGDEEPFSLSQLSPQVISLSPRDYDALVEAIMNPAPPNERLREAARWYRELIAE